MYIEPANGADVTVNGVFISSTTLLQPGQLVTMGHDYVFLFKDATNVKVGEYSCMKKLRRTKFRLGAENFVCQKILSAENFVRRNFVR